jgi:hypothetical protein
VRGAAGNGGPYRDLPDACPRAAGMCARRSLPAGFRNLPNWGSRRDVASARVRTVRRRTVIALCGLLVGGCGGVEDIACTLVGCGSGVTVDLSLVKKLWPTATSVRACVDGRCRSVAPGRHAGITVSGPWLRSAATVTVSIDIEAASGRTLYHATRTANVKKYAPNGVRCGPVCYRAYAMLNPRTRSLTTNPVEVRLLTCQELDQKLHAHRHHELSRCLKRLTLP